ncbi:DUF1080 domain-containing protein [Muricauda sp. CAU 1633]|uniref:3-keto-disaccharide hydrolase n=1 Tax=Allomuricauda sp. CAU 1633 TaxID=2816036 RepID=UPI001A90BEA2|nr:DUF1080 domain-containing protein [Muricauda sp. CAU 1633]MBO0324060.1 DUF1080 domain-containing protein [Muricauda sp. CAU 1633]
MKFTSGKNKGLLLIFILFMGNLGFSQELALPKNITLSAIKGQVSKPDTINYGKKVSKTSLGGSESSYFSVIGQKSNKEVLMVQFNPPADFIGIAKASLVINNETEISLAGLSTKGLEGENEAPLATIFDALGYTTNVGWETLANHLRREREGEELPPSMFQKAGDGKVELIPIARYSPDFPLQFGYFVNNQYGPKRYQAGILATANGFPEHQILFPEVADGKTSFDPGEETFGVYVVSPSHAVYSEDIWNILYHPNNANHAMRIYPAKTKEGVLKNTYIVCMEEAANGDYNDYVFLLKNVKPVSNEAMYESLFNGKDFTNWYKWFESTGKHQDPNNIFSVENGIIHDTGEELGYIMTEKAFANYHFSLEFKWGEKRWPPRENNKRDSGICYNVPEDETDKIWPQSVECQIQEGDVGDFWMLGYSTIQVDGKQNTPEKWSNVVKSKDAEKPNGEWNTVEVISFNGKCVHIVNGVVVNYGENSSLIGGKILLQSEYAEIYYRNIKIRNL